ncbi:S8 family serine peptidase [Halocola ammonii]
MRIPTALTLLLLLTSSTLFSQTEPGKYLVFFTDKENTPYSIDQPEEFLSERAIERRERYDIAITELDLPVDPSYLSQLEAIDGVEIIHHSKWFNAATIATDQAGLEEALMLPFISSYKMVENDEVDESLNDKFATQPSNRSCQFAWPESDYGPSFNQIAMHNGHLLHDAGFRGEGMQIAVLDAGFTEVNNLAVFDDLYEENRLLGTRDFVDGDNDVYHGSSHGTYVLSTMAGFLTDSIIGTAPKASYYLMRTENSVSEYVTEEDNWVVAAEYADSLGVDIINSSLGYSTFDDTTQNHTYADMDGNTTRISRAADIAASRGILVVTSAGNSGASDWHYITAPADADSALTVGAVAADSTHIFFSSFGPTSDGRVKPNLVSQGYQSVICNFDGGVQTGNGTSFSSPILAGVAACLWQAHYQQNNMTILGALEESATHFTNPNDSLGYGIPNAWLAHESLPNDTSVPELNLQEGVAVYPNPFGNAFQVAVKWENAHSIEVEFFDLAGRKVATETSHECLPGDVSRISIDGSKLPTGTYFVRVKSDSETFVTKVLKR